MPTGWRLSWIAAPLWVAEACNKLQDNIHPVASSIAQAAEAACLGEQTCVEEMRQAFERRKI